jgi:PBP1b-binding outer membrane lipoprotein LpoB
MQVTPIYKKIMCMKRYVALMAIALFISAAASSQDVKKNIEKAAKHPDREKNAAKADLRLVNKKNISGKK